MNGRLFFALVFVAGCGRVGFTPRALDGGADATNDATADGAEADAFDADATVDGAEMDALDADAAFDAGSDASDADASDTDASDADDGGDALIDASQPPGPVQSLFPWNGFATGADPTASITVVARPLRPVLRWIASEDAERYEYQLDDSCSGDPATCTFPSPDVEGETTDTRTAFTFDLPVRTARPVGLRYYWRVRACNGAGCSAWSDVRYLDVGRSDDDYDGDGYADLVVGAYYQDAPEVAEGNVFVYFGGPSGAADVPSVTIDNPADQPGGFFGYYVASAGDVNGDGYADLAVGAFNQDSPAVDSGSAYVFFGGPGGPGTTPSVTFDNPSGQDHGFFGRPIERAGDLNGDGYADVVIGAYFQASPEATEGSVFVYLGGAAGPSSTPTTAIDNPADQVDGRFGYSAASAGDVDGDGFPDLVAGAFMQDAPESDEGNVFLFRGGASGVSVDPSWVVDSPGDDVGANFGYAVSSAGDVNRDGYADVIVGAWLRRSRFAGSPGAGAAYVFLGGPGGLETTPRVSLDAPGEPWMAHFGESVASAGDTNGDGFADVIIGAPMQDAPENDEGNAYVRFGVTEGLDAPAVVLDNPLDDAGGLFGCSVSGAGDVNGDGYADIIVGAFAQETPEAYEGAAFVFYGSAAGPSTTGSLTLDNPADFIGGRFGISVH